MKNNDEFVLIYDKIKPFISGKTLLKGTFGLEREGLRVREDGKLAMTPHPSVFGNKLTNPYIKTDFSESQIEVVTPVCHSEAEAYHFLEGLCDIVADELPENEYFWPQSMPCDIPDDDIIPIARFEGDPGKAEEAMAYRRGLMAKYGGKKQLISGIHYNFALDESVIDTLYQVSPGYRANDSERRRAFKDGLYLKIIRGYLRYRWLVVYLTGCSVCCHQSFLSGETADRFSGNHDDGCFRISGPSMRNSVFGYKNLTPLFPDYTSVSGFAHDVKGFVSDGYISAPKELYTQIRMKAKDPGNLPDSLLSDGVQYLEIRTVDINGFDPCGISLADMTFLHHFIIWLIFAPESNRADGQNEALQNEEITALIGLEPDVQLSRDGEKILLRDWAEEILADMMKMEKELELEGVSVIQTMLSRVRDPQKTHAAKLAKAVNDKGFLESQLEKAQYYKERSRNRAMIFAGCDKADPERQKKIKTAIMTGNIIAFEKLTGK